ncbi:MAG: phosphatidylinositol-specific phospholipase C1-like protein [Bacteroidia bacterium]|nr:phosphatidylinositol-specific phospholipase C1-like protein [Bacteroidia bacterium]
MRLLTALSILFFFTYSIITSGQSSEDSLRINEIQVIASHNSYRKMTHKPVFQWVKFFKPLIPKQYDPLAWDYQHLLLPEQFDDYNVRGIELDIYYDPQGGRYFKRKGNWLVFQSAKSRNPALLKPGFKLIHIPDVDYNSHYTTFTEALTELKKWSDSHPRHIPVFVNVEIKNSALGDYLPLKALPKAIPFTPEAADALDAEICSVFGETLNQVITPDKVRKSFPVLNDAVRAGKLPDLQEAKGKIFFIADGSEKVYAQGHPSLSGRVMFTYAPPRSPECVFIIANDAKGQQDSIRQWVKEGYMVRSRCDSDTYEARKGDVSSRDAAFASGAQILSTDYYKPDERHRKGKKWSDYAVQFPENKPFRKNPLLLKK